MRELQQELWEWKQLYELWWEFRGRRRLCELPHWRRNTGRDLPEIKVRKFCPVFFIFRFSKKGEYAILNKIVVSAVQGDATSV